MKLYLTKNEIVSCIERWIKTGSILEHERSKIVELKVRINKVGVSDKMLNKLLNGYNKDIKVYVVHGLQRLKLLVRLHSHCITFVDSNLFIDIKFKGQEVVK